MNAQGGKLRKMVLKSDGKGGFEAILRSDISSLEGLIDTVRVSLLSAGCTEATVSRMDAVTEEVFANICHYAYDGNHGKVSVRLRISGGDATLTFVDSGRPFDPIAYNCNDMGSAEERIGGLGIRMVLGFVDEAEFRREDGSNILILKMKGVVPDSRIRRRRRWFTGCSSLSDELLLHSRKLSAQHADL